MICLEKHRDLLSKLSPNKAKLNRTIIMSLSEHSEQVLLINWVRKAQRSDQRLALLFAIPNGGSRNIATARKLQAEGVLAGVPDLFLPVPCGDHPGLFIELKAKKGRVSRLQKNFMASLRLQGYRAEICHGHKAAIQLLEDYLQ